MDNGFVEVDASGTAMKAIPYITIENPASRTTTSLKLTWGWYNSSVGGCTPILDALENVEPACSSQASGAYIFRPNSSELFGFDPSFVPQMAVETGIWRRQGRLRRSPFTSHTVRLGKDNAHVEVEWTAGPIPSTRPGSRPIVIGEGGRPLRYDTEVASGGRLSTPTANGRETVKRVRDQRGPSPAPYKISEPVAGNYYPVNALASINDDCVEFDVIVIRWRDSMASTSTPSTRQLLPHRRLAQFGDRWNSWSTAACKKTTTGACRSP